jgi:hypothetical protein
MSILQTSPASLRTSAPATNQRRGSFSSQSRPYLITGQKRKPASAAQQSFFLFPHESEDARLTGSTRSLYRRLLALNLPGLPPRIQAYSETTVIGESVISGSKIA